MEDKIIVKQVNLQQYEIDRLEHKIKGQEQTIKYQSDEHLKLMHKLDNKENWGLNCLLFTYDELIDILKHKSNWLYDFINRWFELDEDLADEEGSYCLYFSEDAIEVEKDDYWLVHVKNDYAICFKDIDKLNRKIYELEKVSD